MGARRKLFKRGVSPIVATLLLILIAIAAAAVLYVWVNNLSSSATQYNSGNVASAISIDAADLSVNSTGSANVTAYVRNVGGSAINGIINVYVYNQTGALVASGTTGSVSLQPGQVQPVSALLTNTTNIVTGQVYNIKIVAPTGASAVTSVTAHS